MGGAFKSLRSASRSRFHAGTGRAEAERTLKHTPGLGARRGTRDTGGGGGPGGGKGPRARARGRRSDEGGKRRGEPCRCVCNLDVTYTRARAILSPLPSPPHVSLLLRPSIYLYSFLIRVACRGTTPLSPWASPSEYAGPGSAYAYGPRGPVSERASRGRSRFSVLRFLLCSVLFLRRQPERRAARKTSRFFRLRLDIARSK